MSSAAAIPPERIQEVLDALVRDVRTAGVAVEIGLADLAHGARIGGVGLPAPVGFGVTGFLLRLPGWDRLITDAPVLGDADLAELVSSVQDWVIEQLGRPWPERSDGTAPGVLEPAVVSGEIVWTRHGHSVQVGSLRQVAIR